MQALRAFGIVGCLFAAGCDRAAEAPAAENVAVPSLAPDPAKVLGARWDAMFADPGAVIAAADAFGYKVAPYKPAAAGSGYHAAGVEQVLPDAGSPVRAVTRFAMSGATDQRVDRIDFHFEMIRDGSPDTRETRDVANIPRRIVAGFLSRFGVSPGDPVRSAVQGGTSATTTQFRGRIVVTGTPRAGGAGFVSDVVITPVAG